MLVQRSPNWKLLQHLKAFPTSAYCFTSKHWDRCDYHCNQLHLPKALSAQPVGATEATQKQWLLQHFPWQNSKHWSPPENGNSSHLIWPAGRSLETAVLVQQPHHLTTTLQKHGGTMMTCWWSALRNRPQNANSVRLTILRDKLKYNTDSVQLKVPV